MRRQQSVQLFVLVAAFLAGCDGPQSALRPAGAGAERIANLFWWMLGGGSLIWLVMVGLAIYSVRTHFDRSDHRRIRTLIIGGGTIFPTVVLTTLLLFSLPMIPDLLQPAPPNALKIEVRGKMWWWRVRYLGDGEEPIELANEIRLPVGEPVEFQLASDDVIHAFWIPSLGGKVDMIPGRITRLKLEPTKTGVFRGACAEYCGMSHALMNFDVIVMKRVDFDRWLDGQRRPAVSLVEAADLRTGRPTSAGTKNLLAVRGQQLFLRSGCHACHTIRGTEARGTIGPDLTHVGSRHTIAASVFPNESEHFAKWIAHPGDIKPGVKMPDFDMLSEEELQAIAAYLENLQ